MPEANSTVTRFFANPTVGIIGSLASIVSLVLAVYFYVEGRRYRDFVYYVNPAKTVVVTVGQASRLKVLFENSELRQNVTAAQVAFWNNGTEAIHTRDALTQVVVRTEPRVPVLEVHVRKNSRDVVKCSVDETDARAGAIGLSWTILEKGDGCILQVVYAGGTDIRLVSTGAIEGQREGRELRYSGTIRSPSEQLRSNRVDSYLLFMNAGAIIVFLGVAVYRVIRGSTTLRSQSYLLWVIVPMVISSILLLIGRPPEPPFGFE